MQRAFDAGERDGFYPKGELKGSTRRYLCGFLLFLTHLLKRRTTSSSFRLAILCLEYVYHLQVVPSQVFLEQRIELFSVLLVGLHICLPVKCRLSAAVADVFTQLLVSRARRSGSLFQGRIERVSATVFEICGFVVCDQVDDTRPQPRRCIETCRKTVK
jgi:hypothetical protein